MKKILLTGILTIIGFVGYSSAETINFTCNEFQLTPTSFRAGSETPTIVSNINDGGEITCWGYPDDYNVNDENLIAQFYIRSYGGELELYEPELYYECEVSVPCYGSATMTFGTTEPGGGDEPGETTGGLISGGTEQFSGIIGKLRDILKEFSPYIIYIVLGCLGVSILFNALKSLLGFTEGKAKNSISGREGRRGLGRRSRRGNYNNPNYRYRKYNKEGHYGKERKKQARYMSKNRRRIRKRAKKMPRPDR